MKLSIASVLFFVLICLVCGQDLCDFDSYCQKFNKTYNNTYEFEMRKQIFLIKCNLLQDENSKNTEYQLAPNKFTDWTQSEIDGMCLYM